MIPLFILRRKAVFFSVIGFSALCLLVFGLKAIADAPVRPKVVVSDPDVRRVVAANADFGFRLLKQLNRQKPDDNIFFSPFSLSDALTMTLIGAGGATHSDMAATLGLRSMTQDQINRANGRLLLSLQGPASKGPASNELTSNLVPKGELSIANALWADTGTKFNAGFQKESRRFYDARTSTLHFTSPAAAATINGWVKGQTFGKIDTLVASPDLAGATVVLTNAVCFHGQWSHPFEKSATQEGPFILAPGRIKAVPLMSQEWTFPYLDTSQFQAIGLPYGEGRMSLYVFLPKQGTSLSSLVTRMNAQSLEGWLGKMHSTEVNIILPRFRADYQAKLNGPLTAMGMGSVFRPGANFAPMGVRGLFISKVIHKAIIEVDEEGTVAASATGLEGTLGSILPPTMRVDHPYFCAIRDNATGTLLFAGVIRDPK